MEIYVIDNNTKTAILKTSILIRYYFGKEQKMYFIISKPETTQKNQNLQPTRDQQWVQEKQFLLKKCRNLLVK